MADGVKEVGAFVEGVRQWVFSIGLGLGVGASDCD